MRERGAVAEAEERMHGRGRVDHDLDPVVVEVEEEVRLDQLEALVGERRRVDRDLRAHVPGRVRECVIWGHIGQFLARPTPKWAAGCGENKGVNGLRIAALEALVGGGVFAVDREQPPSPTPPGGRRQFASRHEALLVREGEVDPSLERPERRRETGEAHDGVEDDVRLRTLEQLGRVSADLCQRREPVDRPGT